jgi:hypothetical protein
MSESEIEVQEEDKIEENKPRFVIVELNQLEKLLQRCTECGKLSGDPKKEKPIRKLDKKWLVQYISIYQRFRQMLAVMAYNENIGTEMRGDRRVSVVYQSFSKSRGEKVTKIKKSPANEDWKKDIVHKSLERKQQIGMGNPVNQDDIDENLDIVIGQFDELLNFSDTADDFVE